MKIEYKLTLTSEQAKAINRAIELLIRLKLGQYEELPFYLTDLSRDDFCERRDIAKPYLKQAFAAMQDYREDTEWKDDEWHRLYNIHQAIRYQIHLAEYPDSTGVDSYPPHGSGGQGIPKCSYSRGEADGTEI